VTSVEKRYAWAAVVSKVTGGGANTLRSLHADHGNLRLLGSVSAQTGDNGYVVGGSHARFYPFGTFRTEPTSNPAFMDRGFTGHQHNNTGSKDIGLVYMNARFYLPDIG
jgi:hypothetical protein